MRKIFKKLISIFLVVVMVLCSAPLQGFVGLELPNIFNISSFAADEELECVEVDPVDIEYTILNGTYCTITGYTGNDKAIVIPSEIDGYIVQKISSNAFKDNKTIEKVVMPESLETVEWSVFQGCTSLTYVGFNNKLTNIGNYMFYGCTSLTEITIPNGIIAIGSSAFKNCTGLAEVNLPDTLTTIHPNAFENCLFERIDIPDSVTKLASNAFLNCTKLSEVGYPAGWTECYYQIGDEYYNGYSYNITPFYGCTSLKEITIDEGVTSVPKYAFRNCTSIETVILPESVTTIGRYAFEGCTNLKTIVLSENLTTIMDNAFRNCVGLTEIVFPESNLFV